MNGEANGQSWGRKRQLRIFIEATMDGPKPAAPAPLPTPRKKNRD